MSAEKKDNVGYGYGILAIFIPIVLVFYFFLYAFTYFSIIFGFVIVLMLYGFLGFLFDDWKAKLLRFLFLAVGALTFYLILTYKYIPDGNEYFSYTIDKYIHIIKYTSWKNFFSYPFTHASLKGLSSYEVNEIGLGTFLFAIFFALLRKIFFRSNAIKDLKDGKRVDIYAQKITDKNFKKVDITTNAVGISYYDRGLRYLTDDALNRMLLALGTTGAGKTIFFRNLYGRNILNRKVTVVVDGKPDPKNIKFLQDLAERNNVPFYGFNCANNLGYDFLNNGTPTEIKDKIIGLKNEADWDSDYYKTQAETYLQTALEILKNIKGTITLDDVIDSMDYESLKCILPSDLEDKTLRKINRISNIKTEDIKGIQNQLTLLANSDMGNFLSSGEGETFTLLEAIDEGAFVYFALPALKYPSFAKILGKLVVNDLKTALYQKNIDIPVFSFFDEFGVFAGEQVLNLVNQGRGLGLHSAFGTQSLADLSRLAGNDFLEAFMGNINTIVLLRVNDNKTTSYLSDWIGKEEVQEYQAHIRDNRHVDYDTGTVKMVEKHIIKPSEMQRLKDGDAYFITKLGGFGLDKVRINYYKG